MQTPLADPITTASQILVESPSQFELHQLLRLTRNQRSANAMRIAIAATTPSRSEVLSAVDEGDRTEVGVNPSVIPGDCPESLHHDLIELMHAVWRIANPFSCPQSEQEFVTELRACGGLGGESGLPGAFSAYYAGLIRRGASSDLECILTDYFGVPVQFVTQTPRCAELRIGPIDWDDYLEFLPGESSCAWRSLRQLLFDLIPAGPQMDVVLILRADQVPACVPDALGSCVGIAAWPLDGRADDDVSMKYSVMEDESHVDSPDRTAGN